MSRLTAILIIAIACAIADLAEAATMGPGPVPFDTAAACYDPATGEIIVSVNDVDVWYIESASSSLTGVRSTFPVDNHPFPTLNTDTDQIIGQSRFVGGFTFVDHNLGPVAEIGTPLSDLTLRYTYHGGSPQASAPELTTNESRCYSD